MAEFLEQTQISVGVEVVHGEARGGEEIVEAIEDARLADADDGVDDGEVRRQVTPLFIRVLFDELNIRPSRAEVGEEVEREGIQL